MTCRGKKCTRYLVITILAQMIIRSVMPHYANLILYIKKNYKKEELTMPVMLCLLSWMHFCFFVANLTHCQPLLYY